MIPLLPSPGTGEFVQNVKNMVFFDPEAIAVFLNIHQQYHNKRFDLERALSSCGMILLVRSFTMLRKFVELPRDNSSEAYYRLTLREREDDGCQVIDVQYLDGRVSSVALDQALPGGGIHEDTDLFLEDELLWDSKPDSGPKGGGRINSPVIKEWLRDSYRLDWDWQALDDAILHATESQETGESKMDLEDPGYDDTPADTEMPRAQIAGRNGKRARDSEPVRPVSPPRPIIPPGSSPLAPRLQRQDSPFSDRFEDERRAPTPPLPASGPTGDCSDSRAQS